MEKDQEKKQNKDLIFTDQLFENPTNNTTKTPKPTLTKSTQLTMCAHSPTGHFLSCDPHKCPIFQFGSVFTQKSPSVTLLKHGMPTA